MQRTYQDYCTHVSQRRCKGRIRTTMIHRHCRRMSNHRNPEESSVSTSINTSRDVFILHSTRTYGCATFIKTLFLSLKCLSLLPTGLLLTHCLFHQFHMCPGRRRICDSSIQRGVRGCIARLFDVDCILTIKIICHEVAKCTKFQSRASSQSRTFRGYKVDVKVLGHTPTHPHTHTS